jgi:hypothetical protein
MPIGGLRAAADHDDAADRLEFRWRRRAFELRTPEGRVVNVLSQLIRRTPTAALGSETRRRVEDTVVVAGHGENTVQRRLCKCPLLILEPRCVQTAGLVKAHDEVHPPDHLDRPTVRKLNDDLRHPHALASQRRHGVVLWIAQQPLKDGVPQPDKPALVVNDEPAASDPHRYLSRPQLAVSGLSLRSQSVPLPVRDSAFGLAARAVRDDGVILGQCSLDRALLAVEASWQGHAGVVEVAGVGDDPPWKSAMALAGPRSGAMAPLSSRK